MRPALLLVILVLGAIRARQRPWAIVICIAASLGLVAELALRGSALWDWRVGILDAVLVVVIALIVVDLVGLPDAIARRTGLGLRSRAWEYDKALYRHLAPLSDQLNSAPIPGTPDYGRWRAEMLRVGRDRIEQVKHLRPPDDDWAGLTRRYIDIYETLIAALESGDVSATADVETRNREVTRDRAAMREKYRAEAADALRGRLPPTDT